MPTAPSLVKPVLNKTQRQTARELAYRLLEQGYAPLVVQDYVAMQFGTSSAVIRSVMRYMAKPTERARTK